MFQVMQHHAGTCLFLNCKDWVKAAHALAFTNLSGYPQLSQQTMTVLYHGRHRETMAVMDIA